MPLFPQISAILEPIYDYLNIGRYMAGKKNIDYEALIGRKFNKWTIEGYYSAKQCIMLMCICECGRQSNIQANMILHNRSKMCKSCAAKNHGMYQTATYRSWNGARNRCNNPNNKDYKNYGQRGIKMDSIWDDFEKFFEEMGEKPANKSLDRINNEGNYAPGNCRWATSLEQRHNQRKKDRRVA